MSAPPARRFSSPSRKQLQARELLRHKARGRAAAPTAAGLARPENSLPYCVATPPPAGCFPTALACPNTTADHAVLFECFAEGSVSGVLGSVECCSGSLLRASVSSADRGCRRGRAGGDGFVRSCFGGGFIVSSLPSLSAAAPWPPCPRQNHSASAQRIPTLLRSQTCVQFVQTERAHQTRELAPDVFDATSPRFSVSEPA